MLLANLIPELSDDISSCVVIPRGSRLKGLFDERGVIAYEVNTKGDKSFVLSDFSKYRRVIKNQNPDIVHTHGATVARIAGKNLGKICVMTRHCAYPVRGLKRIALCGVNRLFYSAYTDYAVATAEAAKKNLMDTGVPEKIISVIINGSPQFEKISDYDRGGMRKLLGIREDTFIVGMVARLVPEKGHETVIKAARLLCGENVFFLFLGEGYMRDRLEKISSDLENVMFLGFRKDVCRYMNIFDVIVNASVGTETSCLAISEAMSLGIPCIASDYGGNTYMADGTNGVIFPQGDHIELAKIIMRLKNNPQEMRRLKIGSLMRYDNEFSVERMAREYSEFYRRIYTEHQKNTGGSRSAELYAQNT